MWRPEWPVKYVTASSGSNDSLLASFHWPPCCAGVFNVFKTRRMYSATLSGSKNPCRTVSQSSQKETQRYVLLLLSAWPGTMDRNDRRPIQDDSSDDCSAFCSLWRRTELGSWCKRLRLHHRRRLPRQPSSLLATRSSARLCSQSVRRRTRPHRRWLSVASVLDRPLSRNQSPFPHQPSLNRCRSQSLLRPLRDTGRRFLTPGPRCIRVYQHPRLCTTCHRNGWRG